VDDAGQKKKGAPLLYVGDWSTNDVFVFSGFPKNPQLAGTLTGFDVPYGMCIDKKGDVFISNYAGGEVYEYAHGGTTVLNTYVTSGYAVGCSISAHGDVAVTDETGPGGQGAGQVCIWRRGKGTSTCHGPGSRCYNYLWAFGYDNTGNLIGNTSPGIDRGLPIEQCAILAGASSVIELSSNVKPNYPGGTQWDGKYIAVGDQVSEYGAAGVWEATLSGTTLTAVGSEIVFIGACAGNESDDANPFFTAKRNVTPASREQATGMIGPNTICDAYTGKGEADAWGYPAGGNPTYRFLTYKFGLYNPYGAAISIAE
jgi:hypothetical protein